MIRDAFRFLRFNLEHYAMAVWGLGLMFDPPYPHLSRFFPAYITEPVMEYRTYGFHAVGAVLFAAVAPLQVNIAFIVFWACISWSRSHYLKSNLVFWRQVLKENGVKHTRAHGRYMECLIKEIERRMKAGESWEMLSREAFRLQDEVIRRAGSKDAAQVILGGR